MTFEAPNTQTPDDQTSRFGATARGHLLLASIAFGGGMPCLAHKYLGDAVDAFELEAEALQRQLA